MINRLDPSTSDGLSRISQAFDWSRDQLEPHRDKREQIYRQIAGGHYGKGATARAVPINFIQKAVKIFVRKLASNNPTVLIKAHNQDLENTERALELTVNDVIRKLNFQSEHELWVTDALVSLGVMSLGESLSEDGLGRDLFVRWVSLMDFVIDMDAYRWSDAQFIGHRFEITREEAKGLWGVKVAETLPRVTEYGGKPSDQTFIYGTGDSHGVGDRMHDVVCLWQLWLPRLGKIVILPASGDSLQKKLLTETIWEGPSNGPYHKLDFFNIPGQVVPLAPTQEWLDIHEVMNETFRKLRRQSYRQKEIIIGPDAQELEKIRDGMDGSILSCAQSDKVKQIRFGGADGPLLAFFLQMRQMADWMAGNLSAIAGLGPQASTATQDRMLKASTSEIIDDMQADVENAVAKVIKDIAWYKWTDPDVDLSFSDPRLSSSSQTVFRRFAPEYREGDFLDYNFTIQPYSMASQSPAMRLAKMKSFLSEVYLPTAQIAAQRGEMLNTERLYRFFARYDNMPEIEDLIDFTSPQMPSGVIDPPGYPTTTRREYERISRPGATQEGAENALSQLLMGGNPQSAEMETLGRMVV